MTADFRWGLIGPGRIAHRFAQALAHHGCGVLQAVASRSEQRAQAFASKYNASFVYTNYDDLFAAADVDGVYIATPHNFHFEQIAACIKAGKPVLCEKPLTVTAAQTEALIELSRSHQVFLMEALWSRFLPVYQKVDYWLSKGLIGTPRLVQSNFGFNVPRNESDRLLNPNLAGGVLLDMGVYCMSMSQWVFGRSPLSANASGIVGTTGVDELMVANLDFGQHQFAQFSCNFVSQTENSLTIYGSNGHIKVDEMFWDATSASLHLANGTVEQCNEPYAQTGFEYEIMEAERCIQAGKIESDMISHKMTLETMQWMDNLRNQLNVQYPEDR
ncbi:Gfo/Idh/MocA family protein [Echinimonas agarilytica]|uniref:Gfo/Idh/MocA family oxidoreductase n=1 Tax=Echinimonas agarilytica TaxID=1215918 RepID=A0AA42B677_9GAMM|nr:Gfo/Idh/MocA family oxidoreductase [Echinimonas agarilytica]MCM2678415.1 Gfo/Idh/MocA family oxidoreductase [Echinimonas agarilytica]